MGDSRTGVCWLLEPLRRLHCSPGRARLCERARGDLVALPTYPPPPRACTLPASPGGRRMAGFFQLFRCIGEAFCARGLRVLADVVPLGGAVYEVAEYAWQRYNDMGRDEEVAQLAEAVARATPEEAKAQALA